MTTPYPPKPRPDASKDAPGPPTDGARHVAAPRTSRPGRRGHAARALAAGACLAAAAWAALAAAHELPLATARVSLRDAHFDVAVDVDVVAVVSSAAGVDATTLATAPDDVLRAHVEKGRALLAASSRLEVDGARLPLHARTFPAPLEVRALAARASAAADGHADLVPVALEAAGAFPAARAVGFALAPAAGPAVVSFVQPATRWVAPGRSAQFTVLAPAASAPAANDGRAELRRDAAAAAAVLLAAAALAVALRRRPCRARLGRRPNRGNRLPTGLRGN